MPSFAIDMKFEAFILLMWLIVITCFNGVTLWHDWAIGIVMGGCAVSIFYRIVLRNPKARRFFNE